MICSSIYFFSFSSFYFSSSLAIDYDCDCVVFVFLRDDHVHAIDASIYYGFWTGGSWKTCYVKNRRILDYEIDFYEDQMWSMLIWICEMAARLQEFQTNANWPFVWLVCQHRPMTFLLTANVGIVSVIA